jgi:alpha-glucoside transport system permease protein
MVEPHERGEPGVMVSLFDSSGKSVQSTTSADDGTFTFDKVSGAGYKVGISKSTFAAPFQGISWLGSKLITPSIILAYIWVWAGFAMVVIGAGLAAISREVLEAARTDGASEWQVFRRVTVPMLAPVLSVVFITMLINVLKVFDIVISIAPGSTQSDAAVIAVQMWRQSFGGVNDFGLGSAIAVFLFLLVIPVLLLNVRRFRREV